MLWRMHWKKAEPKVERMVSGLKAVRVVQARDDGCIGRRAVDGIKKLWE